MTAPWHGYVIVGALALLLAIGLIQHWRRRR